MDYFDGNKKAWEEAYQHRHENWGKNIGKRLKEEQLPFFDKNFKKELEKIDFTGKSVGHFCCNNGRELMALLKAGATRGVGFDIAENFIEEGRKIAAEMNLPCTLENCNILDIDESYYGQFDYLLVTEGAVCWFDKLAPFFEKACRCLKPGGRLLIYDIHPFADMLAVYGEDCYDPENPYKICYSYFRDEPYTENQGMYYVAGEHYKSVPFISFGHTMSDIITGLLENQFILKAFKEYDDDASGGQFTVDRPGLPMAFFIDAVKNSR